MPTKGLDRWIPAVAGMTVKGALGRCEIAILARGDPLFWPAADSIFLN
jgi:hypothetical protein